MPSESNLRKEVDHLLQRRPGWTFQAMSSPGALPAWCFSPGRTPELLVTVEGTTVCLNVIDTAEDVSFHSPDELAGWLAAHRPGALRDPKSRAARRFKVFEWE